MYIKIIKRVIDIILSLMGLIFFSWLYLLIAIAIKIDSPGPVFFRQKRVGKKKCGKITYFDILKFRTMQIKAPDDLPTHLFSNPEQYITRLGKILRKTSLDELPQLFNILLGQMSIVGPRPALWNQTDLISEREKYGANDILPGLTGWAQINGRDELDVAKKAKLDGKYVRCVSLWFDIKCLFKTVVIVIKHRGVIEGRNVDKREEAR